MQGSRGRDEAHSAQCTWTHEVFKSSSGAKQTDELSNQQDHAPSAQESINWLQVGHIGRRMTALGRRRAISSIMMLLGRRRAAASTIMRPSPSPSCGVDQPRCKRQAGMLCKERAAFRRDGRSWHREGCVNGLVESRYGHSSEWLSCRLAFCYPRGTFRVSDCDAHGLVGVSRGRTPGPTEFLGRL